MILKHTREMLARVAGEFVVYHHLLSERKLCEGLEDEDFEWMIKNMPELMASIIDLVKNRPPDVGTLARSSNFKIVKKEDGLTYLICTSDFDPSDYFEERLDKERLTKQSFAQILDHEERLFDEVKHY
ncbi:hypothetical protein ACFL22_00730 [Patescibacteria group bacterium]